MHKKRNITHGYTKHYYAGSERIVSKVGGGGLSDIDADPKGEYSAELAEKKDAVKTEYNMAWGCLETLNPIFGNYLTCIGEWSGNVYNVAQEQTCPFFTNLYEMKAVIAPEKDLYFYHSDHLGSASWITNAEGNAIQHLQYLPFGETMVNQRTTSWSSRYSFSAKEKDEESGYSYFGARYYDSDISIWLSVDPMASKYPSLTPYNYCADNPVKLVDPNGEEIEDGLVKPPDRPFGKPDYEQSNPSSTKPEKTPESPKKNDMKSFYKQEFKKADEFDKKVDYALKYAAETVGFDEKKADKAMEPIAQGLVLLNPLVGITNDITTLATGEDMFGNKATPTDKALAVLDIATLGVSKAATTVGKGVAKAAGWINKTLTGNSVRKTIKEGYEKEKQK